MAEKEYVLGNKTKDLLVYTFVVTKPIGDKTLELSEVIKMMETSAVLDERGQVCELKAKVACLESFRHENNMTIMELKAKLYDLMVEKEG